MFYNQNNRLNPNPITKFIAVILLGMGVAHSMNHYLEWAAVLTISTMYFINGLIKDGIKNILVFGVLFFVPNFSVLATFPLVLKMLLSLVLYAGCFIFRIPQGIYDKNLRCGKYHFVHGCS